MVAASSCPFSACCKLSRPAVISSSPGLGLSSLATSPQLANSSSLSDAMGPIPQMGKKTHKLRYPSIFIFPCNIRSRYGDGGDEKGQMWRTGYVLRFASLGHGSASCPLDFLTAKHHLSFMSQC